MTLNVRSGIMASWVRLKTRVEKMNPWGKMCFYLVCIAIGLFAAAIVDLAVAIITHYAK